MAVTEGFESAGSKARAGGPSLVTGRSRPSDANTLKTVRIGERASEGRTSQRHERIVPGNRGWAEGRRTRRRSNPERGAAAGQVHTEPVRTLLHAEQGLEVEVLPPGNGDREISARAWALTARGHSDGDEPTVLRGERTP